MNSSPTLTTTMALLYCSLYQHLHEHQHLHRTYSFIPQPRHRERRTNCSNSHLHLQHSRPPFIVLTIVPSTSIAPSFLTLVKNQQRCRLLQQCSPFTHPPATHNSTTAPEQPPLPSVAQPREKHGGKNPNFGERLSVPCVSL